MSLHLRGRVLLGVLGKKQTPFQKPFKNQPESIDPGLEPLSARTAIKKQRRRLIYLDRPQRPKEMKAREKKAKFQGMRPLAGWLAASGPLHGWWEG